MAGDAPDPSRIMELATGYWASATLLAANRLGVFGALANGPLTAAGVAAACSGSERATTLLLDACAALGLLAKELAGGAALYANRPAAAAFLVPGRPGYLGDAIRWSADQFDLWGRLPQAVRDDAPPAPPAAHLGDDPEQTRTFVLGMHNRARGVARGVVPFIDLAGAATLLDVGGGPGTYATLLAAKYPELHVTVLDLPAVAAIARELIAEAGMSERVEARAGDATAAEYGAGEFDAVLFSGVLHQMSPATIRAMLAGARRALKPGGRVVISDVMLEATKTEPPFAALFSLQMLLTSNEGAVFAADEAVQWLQDAGFTEVSARRLPPPLPYCVITGSVNA